MLRERSQRLTEATQTVQDCMQLRRSFHSLSGVACHASSLALSFLDVPSQTEFVVTLDLSAPLTSSRLQRLARACGWHT